MMIHSIHELALIVNRIKTRRIEIIGKEKTKYGKLTKKLYDGILEGKYQNDREAALDIYGPNFKPNNFTRLKIILTEKLINTLFFIDVSDYNFNDSQKAYIDCEKNRAAIKILIARSARNSAIKLSEKVIRKSMKYGFTDLTLELARILRRHYRIYSVNSEKEKIYHEIVEHYFKLLGAEIEVENAYEIIIHETRISKKTKQEINISIQTEEQKINSLFPKYESYKLAQYNYLAFISIHEFHKDYQAISKTCKKAILYFEKNEAVFSKIIIYQFYARLLAVSVPLKNYEEGGRIAEKILPIWDNGSINWYHSMDYYCLLSLHTGNYEKAAELYELAITNKRFRNLAQDYQELWRVYEAYLEYLRAVGELSTTNKKPFRIGKFVNDVPIFSKDKKGVNVAIIIIQILFLIAQGKEYKVIDKVEALRMYVHTHLRNDDSLRSNCFIKMLMKMVQSNFHQIGTVRRTKKLHEKLSNAPILEKSQSQYVEIIPYENLWQMSLGQLSNRAF